MRSYTNLVAVLAVLATRLSALPMSKRADAWLDQKWDVIVVGAGPAGIIVADRMSEAGKSTLLLEQGGPSYGITGGTEKPSWLEGTDLSRVDVPGLYSTIFTEASEALMCGEKIDAYAACTIGGNSAINAGLYFQPPASDWDTYHPEDWKSANVSGAIGKLVQRQPTSTITSQDEHLYLQSGFDAAKSWLVDGAGYSDVGINEAADEKYNVWGRAEYNYINGQRGGPVRTYLQSSLARLNFHLESGVEVKRVTRSGSKASGIIATSGNQEVTVRLNDGGRVILSAGAIMSPKLLMYSGIGDETVLSDLKSAGILGDLPDSEWIKNAAVGDQLFDNPNTFIELEGDSIESYTYTYDEVPPSDKDLYLKTRSGPYAFAGQTSTFWSYINHTDGTPPTGVQGTINTNGFGDWVNSTNAITLNIYGTSGMLSTGKVTLNASNNYIPGPSKETYFSNPRDASDIAQFIYDIFQALPKSGSGLVPKNIPQNATKEEILTYITTPSAYTIGQVNHYSSSCRIGKCVDSNAQVIGMDNLHVVDASITSPFTVNPQFGVMVAAERASELILALE